MKDMKKLILLLAVAVMMAFVAPAFAQYGSAQVAELSVSPGVIINGHYGTYGDTGAWVGVYNLSVIGAWPSLNLQQPTAFCIEMQDSQPGWGYATYEIVDLWNAPKPKGPGGNPMGTEKAGWISNLFAMKYSGIPTATNEYAATFQAAVWDLVYGRDGAAGIQLTGNPAIWQDAKNWADAAKIYDGPAFGLKLYALSNYTGDQYANAGRQDYVIVGNAVPEPMSIILGLMGLGSVAGLRKLRRK